jgi:hypothetical protein
MSLMICPRCRKPRLAETEVCRHCGRPAARRDEMPDFEDKASLGCLVLLILFALGLMLLPLLLIVAALF